MAIQQEHITSAPERHYQTLTGFGLGEGFGEKIQAGLNAYDGGSH